MDAELAALAAAGATTLVQQMATETWAQARGRVAAFFARRGGAEPGGAEDELEASRDELTAPGQDEETAADIRSELHDQWRNRLRRTLRADPAAAEELRALLDELAPPSPSGRVGHVYNTISGGEYRGTVIQAGSIGSADLRGGSPEAGQDGGRRTP
ncbi:hypothetical protein GBW32_08090 [Streptomyces tsukubensis]|uniref:Uncharacterized protein n=2 Tax=Streptomyces tsukubensis TaxID=83656 RepID=A0A1V4A4H1_9ACTN|nr:hypothetical protein B1H18_24590 [Streptomyces tsukubensis]QFR97597.1 hypothetical protein GBW32_08090 [Streptomyces tsukubensis]